ILIIFGILASRGFPGFFAILTITDKEIAYLKAQTANLEVLIEPVKPLSIPVSIFSLFGTECMVAKIPVLIHGSQFRVRFDPAVQIVGMFPLIKKAPIAPESNAGQDTDSTILSVITDFLSDSNASMRLAQKSPEDQPVKAMLTHEINRLLEVSQICFGAVQIFVRSRIIAFLF